MSYKNLSRNRTYRLSTPVRLGVVAVAACFLAAPVLSNPVNPTVVNGTATFTQAGNVLTVTNSNGAIINWDKFSIAAGEKTHFAQSSASSSVLNRVLNDPSAIYGTLSSNGRVWLINPAGIMVGASGRIDTAAFVASTLNIRNEDFLAGRNLFINDGTGKDVINQGEIITPAGGSVYLIGSNVANEGIITTPKGETILAAGATVSLIDSALPGVKVDITGATGNATNLGTITAEAGRIGIAGVIVKNSGTLNASSVVNDGGRIFLKASQDAYVDGNGRIVTTGTKGGSVEVLGNRVAVMDHASIDASATSEGGDGGRILVGGDYQGKNPDIQNANITYFGPDATLKADAGKVGDGGTVIVWADDTTRAYGNISARGGASGGNGGFVETSGKNYLDVGAIQVDRSAPNGTVGTWLLDPSNVTIAPSGENLYGGTFNVYGSGTVFEGATGTSTINWSTITSNLSSGSVVISTYGSGGAGSLTFSGGQNYTYASTNELWFVAHQNIFGSAINLANSGSGAMRFVAGWDGSFPTNRFDYANYNVTSGTGTVIFPGSSVSTAGNMYIKAGSDVIVKVAYPSGNQNAMLQAGGTLDIETWGNFILANEPITASNGTATVQSVGNQTIKLNGATSSLIVSASASGYGGNARLSTYGSQTIDFTAAGTHSLILGGGAGANTSYGAAATIESGGAQSILNSGAGTLNISLYGGDVNNNALDSVNDGVTICTSCATHNSAQIRSTGAQTINATTITLQGGSGGNGNWAGIESKSTSNVTVYGAITITGGTGTGYYNSVLNESVTNDAGIHSDGAQTINAGSITLAGGGGVATYGGAFLSGKNGQSITTTGNLLMTGGASSAAGQYGLGAPVIIGEESGANITLNIGGTLTMAGGAGSTSYALIGSAQGTPTVAITATGVSMTAGGSSSKIGVLTGGPAGSLTMTATSGSITQDALSAINTATLVALASAGQLQFGGANRVGTVSLTAGSGITYNSNQSFHLVNATLGAAGPVAITTVAASPYGGNIYLGSVGVAGATVVDVTAHGAIYDDNGSGTTNITGNIVNLTSYGGTAGDLAISSDVSASTIDAAVVSGSTNGGIYIRNLSGTPTSVTLSDNASTNTKALFYNSGSFSTFGSSFTAAYGGAISLVSGGGLTYDGGTFTTGGAGSIGLGASGTLAINSPLNGGANDLLLAGSTVNVNNTGSVTTTGDLLIAGSAVNINQWVSAENVGVVAGSLNVGVLGGSGSITANNSLVAVVTGDVSIAGSAAYGSSYIATGTGDLELLVGGNLNITGYGGNAGYIHAGFGQSVPSYTPDASIAVGGDLKLNNGAYIKAANDVYLDLMGSASTLVLNDGTVGYAPSYVMSDIGTLIPATTHLSFLGRSSGGVIINGIETTTTVVGGSGFFAVNSSTPATAGAGLQVTYSATNQDLCAISPDLCNPKPPADTPIDEPPPTFEIVGPGGTQPGSGGGSTAGGTEGSFGGEEGNGDKKDEKKDDKDKKSDQAKDEKKDDKPGQKKVAQCS